MHRDRREGGEGEGKGGSHSLRYGLGGHLPLVGQLVLEAFHLFFPLWEIPLVHGALRGLRWAGNRDFGALSCPDPSTPHPKGSPRMGTAWPRLWGRFPTPQWSSQRLQELLGLFWLRQSLPGAPLMQNPGTEPDLTEIWVVASLGVGSSKQQPEAVWERGSLSFSCLATALKGPGGIWGIHALGEEPWPRLTGVASADLGSRANPPVPPHSTVPQQWPWGRTGMMGKLRHSSWGGKHLAPRATPRGPSPTRGDEPQGCLSSGRRSGKGWRCWEGEIHPLGTAPSQPRSIPASASPRTPAGSGISPIPAPASPGAAARSCSSHPGRFPARPAPTCVGNSGSRGEWGRVRRPGLARVPPASASLAPGDPKCSG